MEELQHSDVLFLVLAAVPNSDPLRHSVRLMVPNALVPKFSFPRVCNAVANEISRCNVVIDSNAVGNIFVVSFEVEGV